MISIELSQHLINSVLSANEDIVETSESNIDPQVWDKVSQLRSIRIKEIQKREKLTNLLYERSNYINKKTINKKKSEKIKQNVLSLKELAIKEAEERSILFQICYKLQQSKLLQVSVNHDQNIEKNIFIGKELLDELLHLKILSTKEEVAILCNALLAKSFIEFIPRDHIKRPNNLQYELYQFKYLKNDINFHQQKSGWLYKVNTWRIVKRLFIFKANELSLSFKDSNDQQISYYLTDTCYIDTYKDAEHYYFQITLAHLQHKEQVLIFYTNTLEQCNKWLMIFYQQAGCIFKKLKHISSFAISHGLYRIHTIYTF